MLAWLKSVKINNMRYSLLFPKTLKSVPKEARVKSHQLLLKAGFIDRALASGVYTYLPLGWRVLKNIEQIIREEMNAIGAQELFLPSMHPKELWQESGRWDGYVPPLFKLKDRHNRDLCLAPTHEEAITDVLRRQAISYKDLPIGLYQFQNKFRNEIRASGGLLRVREFIMKDLYSFDKSEKAMDEYYQRAYTAYENIFKRCGLEAHPVEASSGSIGGNFCHEFVLFCRAGEDRVAVCEKCGYMANLEKAEFRRRNINSKDKELPLKDVYQPKKINTIEEMAGFFKLPEERMLKDVLYRGSDGQFYVLIIRGDLNVNEVKLASALGLDFVEPAQKQDLEKLGTVRGSVPVTGLKGARFYGDLSLETVKNFVGGYKRAEEELEWQNTNLGRDFKVEKLIDAAEVYDGAICAKCQAKLKIKNAVELGHVFKLATKYSQAMGAEYVDVKGNKKPAWMGCYGIGLGRLMAAIVEGSHDQKGIIWPENVAPYQVHLVGLGLKEAKIKAGVEKTYQALITAGIGILYDDREGVSAGIKFMDADLIGLPVRLVVSEKTKNQIEWKKRNSSKTELLALEAVIKRLSP